MSGLLGKNIKFLRTQKGLSQEQFAVEIGLNRGNIASYEKGTAEPNVSNLLKIVKFFNIFLTDLVEKDLTVTHAVTSAFENSNSLPKNEGILIEEIEDHSNKMGRFLSQSNDMQKIFEGFRVFYEFKKAKGTVDFDKMVQEYENLLEVMESLLESHKELIRFLESRATQTGL